jgi:hypothetical protein
MESFASRLEMIRKRSVSHTAVLFSELKDGPEQEKAKKRNGKSRFFIL